MSADEIFPIVNHDGIVIGQATRRECHDGVSMILHPVVHIHVVRRGVGLYLQQRNHDKDIQPDRWDTSVGGHVDYGESIHDALVRESREELGLDVNAMEVEMIQPYEFRSDREVELINPYVGVLPDGVEPMPNPDEIQDGRFWPLDEIDATLGNGVFTPNFEQEYQRIKQTLRRLVK